MKIELSKQDRAVNVVSEDTVAYFSSFLMSHVDELGIILRNEDIDFYDEAGVLVSLYNHGLDAWRKYFNETEGRGEGISSVVSSPWFLEQALKGRERSERNYLTIQDVLDELGKVPEKNKDLPLYVFDYDLSEQYMISAVSLYDSSNKHDSENTLSISFKREGE